MHIPFPIVAILVLPLAAASCAQNKQLTDDQVRAEVATLKTGQTTRDDIILKYGEPAMRLENDRVVGFRLVRTADGKVASVLPQSADIGYWHNVEFSLITVYDDRGVLREYNLVPVR